MREPGIGCSEQDRPLPGSLNGDLTGEERSVAVRGIAQKPIIGRFFSQMFL